jgi:FAD/FMN-containing dehydrogenase
VYRAQVGSESGKALRWDLERFFGEQFGSGTCSRNQLQNESSYVYADRSAGSTDILHEYFVPYEKFAAFLDAIRAIFPKYQNDLLNVTVRNIKTDTDSFLRYADQDVFAFVMLFSQPMGAEAEAGMKEMTQKLIDAAIDCGGRYYLPYRLHASQGQFEAAYPQATKFFEKKRQYDPENRFQNRFYLTYGVSSAQGSGNIQASDR